MPASAPNPLIPFKIDVKNGQKAGQKLTGRFLPTETTDDMRNWLCRMIGDGVTSEQLQLTSAGRPITGNSTVENSGLTKEETIFVWIKKPKKATVRNTIGVQL